MNKSGLPPQKRPMTAALKLGGGDITPTVRQPKLPKFGSSTAPQKTDMPKFTSKHGWPNLGKF
jgi:hypothetical protein